MLTRRSLFGAIAAPAIVQYCNIMPVRALQFNPFVENSVSWRFYPSFTPSFAIITDGTPLCLVEAPPCFQPITDGCSFSLELPRLCLSP